MDVLLVHGYNVTSTKTYGVLPQRLKSAGHKVKDVYLSKYVTLDNDLTLPDLVKAFQAALEDIYGSKLGKTKFACITHSTGGLLLRGWITTYYQSKMKSLPMSHLIMLAPPNHGSRLSSVGKSRLSRLRSLIGIEPGLKILDALELGSAYQWQVNSSWIDHQTQSASGFFPFVISGQWIDKQIWDVLVPATYERGSDGVVRVASANLNMKKFYVGPDGKKIKEASIEGIPFLIPPQASHSDERYGIMAGIPSRGDHPALTAILQALDVKDRKAYQALAAQFKNQTDNLQQTETYYDGTPQHRYSQLIVRVTDSLGNNIHDYAIELLDHEKRGDRFPPGFLSHTFQAESAPEQFVFYLDHDQISQVVGGQVGFRVQSVSQSPLVLYEEFYFEPPSEDLTDFLVPNQTTYVDVVLTRKLNKNVFRLTKNLSYQKIERKAGPDWID